MIAQALLVPAGLAAIVWAAAKHAEAITPKGSAAYLFGGLCTLQLSILVFARRFHESLATMGIRIPVAQSMRIALQSLFYHFLIPFSTGAELSRWAKLKAASPDAASLAVLAAVAFDRAMPGVACMLISLACLPFVELQGMLGAATIDRLGNPVILMAVSVAIAVIAMTTLGRRRWIPKVQQLIRSSGGRFARGVVVVGAASIATQLLSVATMWFLAQWLGIDVDLAVIALGTCGGMLAQVVPISIAGAGAAELGSGLLFVACGATTGHAIMLTTVLYLCKLVGAIEGALLEFPMEKLRNSPRKYRRMTEAATATSKSSRQG